MSVPKPNSWNRAEFFAWLDRAIGEAQPPIPDMATLAALSGISHSTLSTWRSGKYRPTQDKLTLIANVLKKPRRDVWLIAGLVDADDVVGSTPIQDGHEPTADERRAIALIQQSKLSDVLKRRLIADHLEEMRRAREAVDRSTQSKIAMLEEA